MKDEDLQTLQLHQSIAGINHWSNLMMSRFSERGRRCYWGLVD